MMKSILVGYDATESAKRALARAAAIAKAFGSEVTVISVAPLIAGVGRSAGPIDPTDSVDKHRQELADARALLEGEDVTASYVPAVGEPADAIVQLASEAGVELIVVGTREPNFVQRLLGQSVSESVAHKARCDVLIVH